VGEAGLAAHEEPLGTVQSNKHRTQHLQGMGESKSSIGETRVKTCGQRVWQKKGHAETEKIGIIACLTSIFKREERQEQTAVVAEPGRDS